MKGSLRFRDSANCRPNPPPRWLRSQVLRTGKTISVGLSLVARDANGVGSRFRATTNHMEDAFSENDSRPPCAKHDSYSFAVHPAEARATEFLRGALRSAIIFLKTRALPRRGRTNQPGA
jgi:hypothetical protein